MEQLERLIVIRNKHQVAAELRSKGEKYNYGDYLDNTEYFKLCFMIGVLADKERENK